MSAILLIGVITLVGWILYKFNNPKHFHKIAHFGGPPQLPIIGDLHEIVGKNSFEISEYITRMDKKYTSPIAVKRLGAIFVQIFNPDHVQALLRSKTNITKGKPNYDFVIPWLGLGVLTSTGAQWAAQRKILTPAFHFNILKQFLPIFDKHARRFVDFVEKRVGHDGVLDVRGPLQHTTLDMICETSMGKDLGALNSTGNVEELEYSSALHRFATIMRMRPPRPWLHNEWVFKNCTSLGKESYKCVKIMHQFTEKVIAERQSQNIVTEHSAAEDGSKIRLALLDLLIDMQRQGQMSFMEIRNQIDTFMFAGHDTTSNSLMFSLFAAGTNTECQQKIIDEIDSVFPDKSADLTWDGLQNLPYMDMFTKEVARRYPTVPLIGRYLEEDLVLDDKHTVPKGISVGISIRSLHMDPFPNPEKFDPDRFLPEAVAQRHPFAFAPFSAGARNCIGQKFAYTEMKAMLVRIFQNYRLECAQNFEELQATVKIVMTPTEALNIRFIKNHFLTNGPNPSLVVHSKIDHPRF